METFYLGIIIFIFVLAIYDIMVGVSNDAVNFLNSAVGSKAAGFKTILIIAAAGIFLGAAFSNGMMDIARHGIYQPQHFYFSEIMCILLAVMLTDVVLLDLFNSLGLPTSTTVSMVFELLGATFAIAIIKIANTDSFTMGQLINTDKALSVIMAIFLSVAVAFLFGLVVQYLARLLFTFNYKTKMKYTIGLFGGLAATAIIYFIFIKGLKESSFMTAENKLWIHENTMMLVLACFVCFSILMQILHWLKVSVFKVVVLLGTFALALAFAGNDLVNFIGVPLAAYSSYLDFFSQAGTPPTSYLMTSLLGPAQTPWYFLAGAGGIMVYALTTSRKAQNVIKTSVDLSRQEEGEENFGSTPLSRKLVRFALNMSSNLLKSVPQGTKRWINTRFQKDEAILADGAAFDLVRASVNLVLASLLIALGTSLKLPLSTTYVTFMVAMGTSLADRAWGRDSAVYRITGVLSVIGGWFLTAGAAFLFCFIVAVIIYYGGIIALLILVAIAVSLLVRSQLLFKRKNTKSDESETLKQLMRTTDSEEALDLLRSHTRVELGKVLRFAEENYSLAVMSFINENLKGLRKAWDEIKEAKVSLKQMKRTGTVAVTRLDNDTVLKKGLYYIQGNDFAGELIYSIGRLCEPALEHIDNNFNPLSEEQQRDSEEISARVTGFIDLCREKLEMNEYEDYKDILNTGGSLHTHLANLKKGELKRIQNQSGSVKVSMVYLTIIQESQNVVTYTANLLKVSRKFQTDYQSRSLVTGDPFYPAPSHKA